MSLAIVHLTYFNVTKCEGNQVIKRSSNRDISYTFKYININRGRDA